MPEITLPTLGKTMSKVAIRPPRVTLVNSKTGEEKTALYNPAEFTEDITVKTSLNVPDDMTFYSSVISHSYYSIFYAAKALLLTKKIITNSPEIHKKTFESLGK